MPSKILNEIYVIIRKNTTLDLKSPITLVGEFVMPAITCFMVYIFNIYSTSDNPGEMILAKLMSMMLPFYLGNMTTSTIRKFSIYFVNEREEYFRTYQIVLGMSKTGYILGNLLYMYFFTSMILTPVFLTFMYFQVNLSFVYYFAAFTLASCNFILALLTFFKDPKIATEVIGMICSISLFIYYSIDMNQLNSKKILT
jgi:hypothetical protein